MIEVMEILLEKMKLELKKQTETITENLTKSFEEKINPWVEENLALKKEVVELKTKVAALEKETRRNNVILHGVPENEKNNSELLQLILKTLNESSKGEENKWDQWEVSKVHRLGKKLDNKARPILITTTLAWRKIEILRLNKKFPDGIYATEDFPKDVIQRRNDLKPKLKEELKKGNIAYIRYDKLIIKENTVEKRKRSPSKSPKTTSNNQVAQNPKKLNKTSAFTTYRTHATNDLEDQ